MLERHTRTHILKAIIARWGTLSRLKYVPLYVEESRQLRAMIHGACLAVEDDETSADLAFLREILEAREDIIISEAQ